MKKLEFEIYIGHNMVYGQGEKIIAVVIPKFYIPHGRFKLTGEDCLPPEYCFVSLYDLGTFIADWFDIANSELFEATIFLNKQSLHKKFYGSDIVKIIDKLGQFDFSNVKNFNF